MNEFKEKIYDLIINIEKSEIIFENFLLIYNWPEISYYDEETDNRDYHELGVENCSITDLSDNCIVLTCGGDCQEPHMVRIELLSGELAVTSCEPHEFLSGLEYEEVLEELNL